MDCTKIKLIKLLFLLLAFAALSILYFLGQVLQRSDQNGSPRSVQGYPRNMTMIDCNSSEVTVGSKVHSNRTVNSTTAGRKISMVLLAGLDGGIGNQLYQYACHYALAKSLKLPLYIPRQSNVKDRKFQPDKRDFALDLFETQLTTWWGESTENKLTLTDTAQLFKVVLEQDRDATADFVYSSSYCQSIEYWRPFENEIRGMFRLRQDAVNISKLEVVLSEMNDTESVAVHVRRGDFVDKRGYGVPLSYQRRAIRKMTSLLDKRNHTIPVVFFIFSDDLPYVREKLKKFVKTCKCRLVYVNELFPSNLTSIEDFYLMTQCKHIITPDSTFSWWAAYLMENPKKIVIASAFDFKFAPFREYVRRIMYGKLFHPKEWIVIDPFSGGLAM